MVYIQEGTSAVPRKVEIGLDNNRMVRIISGLKEGEVVSLDPPLKSSSVDTGVAGGAEPNAPGDKTDGIDQQVRDRLDASRKTGPGGTAPGPTGSRAQPQAGQKPAMPGQMPDFSPGQMPPGMPEMTPEQQKKMQEGMKKAMDVMKNLSEEEKEKLKNMSMDERIKFFQERMGEDKPK